MRRHPLREWLLIARNLAIVLAVVVFGELLPPLQALEQWIAPRRAALAWAVGGMTLLGWALLMGGALYRIVTGGGSLTREEIAEQIGRVRSYHSAPMAVARGWRVRLPKRAWGAGFSDEISIAQFKEGWRLQLWRDDARWRGLFLMAFGALGMLLGAFGLVVVLAAPGLKLLVGGALLYALVQVARALAKA